MEVKVSWDGGNITTDVPGNEDDVFKLVGKCLLEIGDNIPNHLYVETGIGDAYYDIIKRGTWKSDDGKSHPSMYVTESRNWISGLKTCEYPERYLTCVHKESNNFKFYHIKPRNVGGVCVNVGATYGRIGSDRSDAFGVKDILNPYPAHMFWIRYYEKLSKGYTDQSDIYLDDKPVKSRKVRPKVEATGPSATLYSLLRSFAKGYVERTLATPQHITEKQIREGWKEWKLLCQMKTLNGFNKHLEKLIQISPRKTRYVSTLYASDVKEFTTIIDREETLLNAMEAVKNGIQPGCSNGFGSDFEVYEATQKQVDQVKRHLNNNLDAKIKTVYRVIPKQQKEKFNHYLEKNKIEKVKLLWHGSKNENWLSIMQNGLQLHPNAQITGKMLGDGIYFAPSAMKSWGYTSYSGSYWAKGNQNIAVMGLYAVAYGKPLELHSPNDIRRYSKTDVSRAGKNCVHAYKDSGLYNDEIVFYDESAMLLNYIVVFE